MAKPTCSVEGCSKTVRARKMCGAHYEADRKRRRLAGDDGKTRPCVGCGSEIHRTKSRGAITPYCSDGCRPQCVINGCEESSHARGWCVFHYSRWAEAGSPEAPLTVVPHKDKLCAFEGCKHKQRKREWCSSHYNQWRSDGQVGALKYTWADGSECVVCGKPTRLQPGFRKFCSPPCQQLWMRYSGAVPTEVSCVRCTKPIPLTVRGKGGYRRRADVKLCRRCRMDLRKHGMSVEELARRDGIDCGLCGREVDMDARLPDLMCPSVDHIKPRAKGGDNNPANLQLAHFLCNAIKQDRMTGPAA